MGIATLLIIEGLYFKPASNGTDFFIQFSIESNNALPFSLLTTTKLTPLSSSSSRYLLEYFVYKCFTKISLELFFKIYN